MRDNYSNDARKRSVRAILEYVQGVCPDCPETGTAESNLLGVCSSNVGLSSGPLSKARRGGELFLEVMSEYFVADSAALPWRFVRLRCGSLGQCLLKAGQL